MLAPRCDKELAKLQQQVDLRAERLRREVAGEEAGYLSRVAALEAEWAGVRRGFGELEGRMNGVTQAATKISNRLQVGRSARLVGVGLAVVTGMCSGRCAVVGGGWSAHGQGREEGKYSSRQAG